jgi:hypothetical protein
MTELYREIKLVKRSRYLVVYVMANKIWLLPEIPAQDRVFHIFSSSIMTAAK